MPPAQPSRQIDLPGKPHGTHICVPYKPAGNTKPSQDCAAAKINHPAGAERLPAKSPLHTKTGRIAPNSALFSTKTGQLVHNRRVSAERRKSSKKFCKNAKKHLQFVRCRAIIFLGCERLVQIVTSVLRKPRYALMREVACAAWRRVFPRSMSDLRTGRKNYGNKGICTCLHSAGRTNVHLTL